MIEVDQADHRIVRVQLRDAGADYSHLFTGDLGVYFGAFVLFDGAELRAFDAEVQSPVALDLVLREIKFSSLTSHDTYDRCV